MKKLILYILFMLVALSISCQVSYAEFRDPDGAMVLSWAPPTSGNPVNYYQIRYVVNPKVGSSIDSVITVETTRLEDSTVILLLKGQCVVAGIRAISVLSDTSVFVWSDTAYYADPAGIGPPTNVMWK